MEETGIIHPPLAETPSPANEPSPSPWRKRITITSLIITLISGAIVLPPLINIGRYQRQVTSLVSRSIGRPVQLSSVELRLLPRPGFVLTDLSVAEDPAFGIEPVLTARTVVASIGIFSLWRGKLSIARVSVDEASLNLVQSAEGRWNLETLMMGAQPDLTQGNSSAPANAQRHARGFPYLEATNSRVNLKHSSEKTPFSILNTTLSLWQDDPGLWRIRLRGQPVRTDIEMSWEDTGDIRLEASLRSAPQLRDMPLQLQMEWRDAHLGQLSRLLLGSDAGWRGDLTADIEVHGTAESASTKARLKAIGVRREEFAPETPIDLDSNCSFRYQHSLNAVHNLSCVTAVGNGQLLLKAELPGTRTGGNTNPEARLEVNQVPFQAALDLLRTVRAGFAPGITASGVANGTLSYRKNPADTAAPSLSMSPSKARRSKHSKHGRKSSPNQSPPPSSNLQGALSIEGVTLKGGELVEPLTLPAMTWTPSPESGLETSFTIAQNVVQNGPKAASNRVNSDNSAPKSPMPENTLSGPVNSGTSASSNAQKSDPQEPTPTQPINVSLAIKSSGYAASIKGSTSTAALRALSYAFGLPHAEELDSLSGGTADLDLTAQGSWLDKPDNWVQPSQSGRPAASSVGETTPASTRDQVSGTLQLHRAEWNPSYLPRPVNLALASISIRGATVVLNSNFSYGARNAPPQDTLDGAAIILGSLTCKESACPPSVQLHFGQLDAAQVQTALLGKPEEQSIFSSFMSRLQARLHSTGRSQNPVWPTMPIQVQADSLALGPVTLKNPALTVRIVTDGDLTIESWKTGILGGSASGTGTYSWASDLPNYQFEGNFSELDPAAVGNLVGNRFTGGSIRTARSSRGTSTIAGSGKITLKGLDSKQLAASASGQLDFNWPGGTVATATAKPIHFSEWSGTLVVQHGHLTLAKNTLVSNKRSETIEGSMSLTESEKPLDPRLSLIYPMDHARTTEVVSTLNKPSRNTHR